MVLAVERTCGERASRGLLIHGKPIATASLIAGQEYHDLLQYVKGTILALTQRDQRAWCCRGIEEEKG